MTYGLGVPYEWLQDMRLLLSHGLELRQVMIGLDDVSFCIDPRDNEKDIWHKSYQQYDWRLYLSLLLTRPGIYSEDEKWTTYDIYNTGRTFHERTEKEIAADPHKHINDKKFLRSSRKVGNRLDETIKDMQDIKDLADQYGIELVVFINPTHRTTYLDLDLDEFNEFKRRLANITGYYDFSGINAVTTDNYNYYDTAHYRPFVGDMMIDRMFGAEEYPSIRGFGVWVTKDDVEAHIHELESEVHP